MLTGACHCEAVRWTFEGDPGRATACNCTICRRYGALWAYGWEDQRITTHGETEIYVRGDRKLGFHHCPNCGCVTWWRELTPRSDGRTQIAVNLRMADEPDAIAHLSVRHFDGLVAFKETPNQIGCVADLWF
ncbi:GFA family protein [Gymnodinialimonas sp. 2305UL16-5]|uniref:GFA family protein n=1 Tax=Gymnodinialimonas mytili TaxID=3126503 RepID=UPI0030A406D2